jgi:hypothetical protein
MKIARDTAQYGNPSFQLYLSTLPSVVVFRRKAKVQFHIHPFFKAGMLS